MSLTTSTGPFSTEPKGRFNFKVEPATGSVLFWDPVPQRLRVKFAGETIVDTRRAKLLHETGLLPVYYVPEDDVRRDLLEPSSKHTHCPHKGDASYWTLRVGDQESKDAIWFYPEPIEPADFLRSHVAFYWNRVDAWYAEDEELFGHPRDPYARIDVYPISRRVRVLVDGEPARRRSARPARGEKKQTRCAYKGVASYGSVGGERDVAWTYPEPQHDGEPIRGMIAFFNERVDIEVDGEVQERPVTQWSR